MTATAPAAKSPKLSPERVKNAEFARNVHRVSPDIATEVKDLLNPDYWAHVAAKFQVGDKIEVLPEGGAWYAELLVTSCSRLHAKLVLLLAVKLSEEAAPKKPQEDNPFRIEHKGANHKWSVIRSSDKAYVKDAFNTREEAAEWLEKNKADLTAA